MEAVILAVVQHGRRFALPAPNGKVFTRVVCVRLVSSRNCYPETDDKNASVDMASIWAVNRLSSSFNDASCVSSVPLQTASVRMMAR